MKRLPAFSLVEIAIGLFIVGLLLMAVMKGAKLVDSAKLQTCIQQIAEVKRDFENYMDGLSTTEAVHLADFKLPQERPKLGGKFSVEVKDGNHVLALANTAGEGFLSGEQALSIQKHFPETDITGCDPKNKDGPKTCKVQVRLEG